MHKLEAVALDIDGTLTQEISWTGITRILGASEKFHTDLFERFVQREISYEDAKDQLIGLWRSTGCATKVNFEKMFAAWPLQPKADTLVRHLKKQGYQICLITGSVDLFAEIIAKRLAIDYWFANTELVWNQSGELIDLHYVQDQSVMKLEQLKQFISTQNLNVMNCAAIGDSSNDVAIFRATKHGIAVPGSPDDLLAVAWKRVDSLAEILEIL